MSIPPSSRHFTFAFEKMLDRRKQDDSFQRENLVSVRALPRRCPLPQSLRKFTPGFTPVPTRGKVVIFDLLELSTSKHVVLRKPWCPACYSAAPAEGSNRHHKPPEAEGL